MVYVTGDMHGDISRFKSKQMRKLRKDDTLIICGDFGFLWDGSSKESRLLKWIGKRPYQVLFLEGTHDNLELLGTYPETHWHGGLVREISGKLKHLCRGHVFELEGKRIFVFGGGSSEDADIRRESGTWWHQELPGEDEVAQARTTLEKHQNQVDYIITHQGSRRIKQFLSMDKSDASILDAFLDEVRASCKYKGWYFGGVHADKRIPPAEMALFRDVVPLEDKR